MKRRIRSANEGSRWRVLSGSPLLCFVLLGVLAAGCHGIMRSSTTNAPPLRSSPATRDARIPLPLLPHMAQHQSENMRDHLAAIQEILAALSTNDFAGAEHAASRIGYTEQMGRMCEHMGTGAPGFTDLALHFHRTADTIGTAAKRHDTDATLKAVAATLQTCVGCHATYRQQIVDEAAWNEIATRRRQTPPGRP